MNKYLILICILIFQNALTQTKNNFKVLGNVKNFNNQYIYFSYEGSGKGRKWDSIKIKKNKFNFSGFITESKNGFLTTLKRNRVSELSDPKLSERIFIDPNSTTIINIVDESNFHTAKIVGSNSQYQFEEYQKLKKSNEDDENFIKNYIRQNYNTYFGLYLLKDYIRDFSFADLNKFYENLSPFLKNSEYGNTLLNAKSELEKSMPGHKAINFSDLDLMGKKFSLTDFEGKFVLLDFWATWCKPCREKNPELVELFNKYNKDGFTIIAIADDIGNEEKWKKAILKDRTEQFVQIIDNSEIGEKYSIPYLPTQILIDKNGNIINRYDNINEPFENLKKDLEKIFGK